MTEAADRIIDALRTRNDQIPRNRQVRFRIGVNLGDVMMQGSDLLGDPMNCLAWLAASSVAEAFGGLKAGQVVMLGSVVPVIWLTGPASVTVDFSPLPPVQVTLV